jgi:hypothetical protein
VVQATRVISAWPKAERWFISDRLGRRASELVGLIDELAGYGIAFKALNAPWTPPRRRAAPSCRSRLRLQKWRGTSSASACVKAWTPPGLVAAMGADRAL